MQGATGLRVAIDTRLTPQLWGGVAHAAKGLIQGLSELEDGDERYVIVVSDDEQRAWIGPHLGDNQQLVDSRTWRGGAAGDDRSMLARVRQAAKHTVRHYARRLVGERLQSAFPSPHVEVSNGFFESLACDVMHFPSQRFVLCAIPSVYNPHDLQHLHYPQFFDAEEIARREVVYRTGCQIARCVMVGSEWIKQDVVSSYGIDPRRVQVIPEGARTQFATRPDDALQRRVRERLGVSRPFVIYPATTWPHKNHLLLFEALATLREQGLVVNLVCTGSRYDSFWPTIESSLRTLNLQSQVQFLGFLEEGELAALYTIADALILPSLFEASSLPIFEAWHAGIPVASSNATALPEQVVDAALLFDPTDVRSIVQALRDILSDHALRSRLVQRGSSRLKDFDWRQTARGYRAVYRRTVGRRLTDEDRWLLSWESMRDAGSRPPSSATAAIPS